MPFTTDPGLKFGAVAAAIAQAFDGIDDVQVYDYDPLAAELPQRSICVGAHETARTDLEDPEQRLGRVDFDDEWEVTLYVRIETTSEAWRSARSILGQMVAAIDDDVQLGGQVQEARLTSSSLAPEEADQGPRRLIGTCTVAVKYLMPDPT